MMFIFVTSVANGVEIKTILRIDNIDIIIQSPDGMTRVFLNSDNEDDTKNIILKESIEEVFKMLKPQFH